MRATNSLPCPYRAICSGRTSSAFFFISGNIGELIRYLLIIFSIRSWVLLSYVVKDQNAFTGGYAPAGNVSVWLDLLPSSFAPVVSVTANGYIAFDSVVAVNASKRRGSAQFVISVVECTVAKGRPNPPAIHVFADFIALLVDGVVDFLDPEFGCDLGVADLRQFI